VKISYNWLKEYIKSDLPIEKIASHLTDLGLEVEGVNFFETVKGGLEGVVVGEIISCIQHPNADRLKLTKVKVNKSEILQIVCGAPNVDEGQKVPVALVGSKLYTKDGVEIKIKASKIRGEESHGMICAEDELGLGDSHDGILVLSDDIPIGTPCGKVFKISEDYVFDIGLTPNRADAMSHMGVARDLKASFIQNKIKYEWNSPTVEPFPSGSNTKTIGVQVNNPEICPRYFGITLTDIKIGPSPSWMQNLLKSVGISPKNNIVDITNYVLHDLGQPLHAFDADRINGKIIVKTLKNKSNFKTLDGSTIKLSSEDLMICDEKKPLCLAGIYGGESSAVNQSTTNIFLESAYFDPISIRKSAKRHGLSTDASFRFERGIDPEITEFALKRASLLMIKYANANVSSEIQEACEPLKEKIKVFLSYDKINKTIGQVISKEDLTNILNALEIKIESVSVEGVGLTIPRYRVDVNRPADIIEEILRVYGYNSILNSTELKINFPEFNDNNDFFIDEYVSIKLVGKGFIEVINNSITNPAYDKLSNLTLDKLESIKIINPLGNDLSQLRKTLVYSGLEVIAFNLNRQQKNIKVFELGKTYFIESKKNIEHKSLFTGLVKSNDNLHWSGDNKVPPFFYLKGVITDILNDLNLKNLKFTTLNSDFFSEGLSIESNNKEIGHLGLIKKTIRDYFGIDQEVYASVLNINYIEKSNFKENFNISEIAKFPFTQRDFALLLDKSVSFESIVELSKKTEQNILDSVELFDVYEGNKIPNDKKSYGIRFTFLDKRKTLTDNYIDKVMNKLKKQFEQELNAQLR
jgi:phenylalanyl-tRNA synthetase beta chain